MPSRYAPTGRPPGREPKYPWNLWLDGEPHDLIPGEDFHIEPRSMQQQLVTVARRRGMDRLTTRWDGRRLMIRYRRRRAADYPWDTWLALGVVKVVQQGRDFQCDVDSFQRQARRAARERGWKLKTRRHQENGYTQFAMKPELP